MLPDPESHQRIQSIKVDSVEFVTKRVEGVYEMGRYLVRDCAPELRDYSKLKTLVLVGCGFNNTFTSTRQGQPGGAESSIAYQKDALHTALRGCPILEYLEVSYQPRDECKAYVAGQGKRITMPALKTAILPSPSAVWCIDITAPVLESLAFNTSGFRSYRYDNAVYNPLPGEFVVTIPCLIPSIDTSPCHSDGLLQLQTFEIACFSSDTVGDLQPCASRLDNVTSLTIRNAGAAFPKWVPTGANPDTRLSSQAVQALTDNIGTWFPKLTELEFQACLTPGKALVEYVRKRKERSGCEPLKRLTLVRCGRLSQKAKRALGMEVPIFSIKGESAAAPPMMARYIDDDFEDSDPSVEE
ncbi:hypothetical protein NCC49_004189 [Naganishia albida]|nr:hypothetical protein NCC49_004189 [Naganishia albida]